MNLNTPIQYVKGVGPKRAKLFNKLGVSTVEDLLNYFPRDWLMPSSFKNIDQLEVGQEVIIMGKIVKVNYEGYGRVPRMKITIDDGTGNCQALWFNGGWLRSQLKVGMTIMLTGRTEFARR